MGVLFPTPVVIVSQCLELDACRYNAQRIRAPLVLALHHLGRALARPASSASHVNVLLHALGFFAARLTAHEKALFLDHLDQYRENRLSLDELLTVARAWIARLQQPYLAAQTYFEPYPSALALSETPSAKSPDPSGK